MQRVNDFKGGKKQSDISLTQKGRAFVLQIILPALLDSPPIESSTISLDQLAKKSADLYYPYSNSSKMKEHQNSVRKLVQVITQVPQTAQELAKNLNISADRIRELLKPHIKGSSEIILEIDGQPITIVREKIKGVWYYSIKNPQSETA